MFANKFQELTCFHMQGNLIWVSDFFDILQNGAVEVF